MPMAAEAIPIVLKVIIAVLVDVESGCCYEVVGRSSEFRLSRLAMLERISRETYIDMIEVLVNTTA